MERSGGGTTKLGEEDELMSGKVREISLEMGNGKSVDLCNEGHSDICTFICE